MTSPERRGLWSVALQCATTTLLFSGFCLCQRPEIISSMRYPNRWLRPYDWTYLRVELPSSFSFVSVTVLSDIDVELKVENIATAVVPILCFRAGGLPLPDASDDSWKGLASSFIFNGSIGGFPNHQLVQQCFSFKKNFTLTLTNEQIMPGIWYIGFFNGLGPERTQSKMIRRGHSHKFSTAIDIAGCTNPNLWGQYCNQTVFAPVCAHKEENMHIRRGLETSAKEPSPRIKDPSKAGQFLVGYPFSYEEKASPSMSDRIVWNSRRSLLGSSLDNSITCTSSPDSSCIKNGYTKLYSLDIVGPTLFFKISATDITVNKTSAKANTNADGVQLMCYIYKDIFPSRTAYNNFSDLAATSMVIASPAIGRWYIMISAIAPNKTKEASHEMHQDNDICFSLEWEVQSCPLGKAGSNCTWESYKLERVFRRGRELPFKSYYLPPRGTSMDSSFFPLENLLSNASVDGGSDIAWTYFLLDIPNSAGGSNIHIKLISDEKLNYEIYSKFGSLPSIGSWDYHANRTSISNNSMLLAKERKRKKNIDFYILYPKEGSWIFGIKHPATRKRHIKSSLSISTEACPGRCSSHGDCKFDADESGMTAYGYCTCDRDHGGFDCSVVIVTPKGHLWQSIFLIGSNGAAILPAIWALRKRALAEWVIFSCSGISSGLYHACDVGTWCILGFHVLQFMDFWLSFMAVLSTCIYMVSISETHKRAILTASSIFTSLLAIKGPTRPRNIVLVIAIGTTFLILGWLIESLSSHRHLSIFYVRNLHIQQRLQNAGRWPRNIITFILKKFRFPFIILGFTALAAAGISWKLESSKSYWIWHSIWHLTIYTSSFFFLCSTRADSRIQEAPQYELARQNSSTRSAPNGTNCG